MTKQHVNRVAGRQLWYRAPARNFNEALPIGNGRLGAMVHGNLGREVLPINDDCFWAGSAPPEPSPRGPEDLARVRDRLMHEDYVGAEQLVEETLLTEFNQPYLPAAELWIDWPETEAEAEDYRRSLELARAVAEVRYASAGYRVCRQYLSSPMDQVVALHVEHGPQQVKIALQAKVRHQLETSEADLALWADAPATVIWPGVDDRCAPGEGITYSDPPPRRCLTMVRVLSGGGRVTPDAHGFSVSGTFTVLIATATTDQHDDPATECKKRLDAAQALGFDELQRRHVQAHGDLFNRVELALGQQAREELPTDERLRQHLRDDEDSDLEALIFDYGRYLLISSSRPGCQPANLQGIWNDLVQPPWWSNYTLNINLQMNYWAAEVCNLAECHAPLFDFIAELAQAGERTAQIHYGMAGWVAHHQTDYLRQTTPVGKIPGHKLEFPVRYAMWPMAGGWLCQHLWQHYIYGGDSAFLRKTAWPLMHGAALFFLDWLMEGPDGQLTTAPSTSPENLFLTPQGHRLGVSMGSAMDRSIMRELFETCLAAAAVLGLPEDATLRRIRLVLDRLPGLEIGSEGQVMEWHRDWAEGEHPHRHVSHLYNLFPGKAITPAGTPELAAAARRTLDLRGEAGTGWSFAWKIALWARLQDAPRAYGALRRLLSPVSADLLEPGNSGGGIYPNLLMACPPFQIDANLGFPAAVAEMLVQSSVSEITLLPALPEQWADGYVRGLRCRGQISLDMYWTGGRVTRLVLSSEIDQSRTVCFGDQAWKVGLAAGNPWELDLREPVGAEDLIQQAHTP